MPRKPRPNCLFCGEETKRPQNIYCSNKCQKQFEREQNAQNDFVGCDKKQVRNYLLETRGYQCEACQGKTWQGKPIPLEVEHINGIYSDNRLDNLKLLCCNCHALTPTYKAKNKGNGRHKRRQRYKEGKSY